VTAEAKRRRRNAAGVTQRDAPQYDAIAAQYQLSGRSPLRRYVERYTFLGLVGDVTGLDVLDLACGEGVYTREMRARGARRATGVDISSAMIALAREQEQAVPLGIEYLVSDVQHLPDLGRFDLVMAAYLLHYARNAAELGRMCERIAHHLPPGGRFVALNENPEQPAAAYAGYAQYGFGKSVQQPRRDGSPIAYTMIAGREVFCFEVYHHERGTYEQALAGAGFRDIRWHPVRLDPDGELACGRDYWQEYLYNPPIVALDCRKAS
jgi:2-polyprenyl-3-methyl-5-hydroxy-6-metoxy-1,4-benzoquinol methylase